MSEQKIVISQQQSDGSYLKLLPENDSWSKVQTLSDLTRELLGLDSSSVPDDAFIALSVGKDSKAYRIKVTYPNGQPAAGFTIGGLTAFPALRLVTNDQGIVMGSSTSSTPTITVAQKYDDVKAYSGVFTSTRMITDCNIVLEWKEENIIYTSSQMVSYNCSKHVAKIQYLLVAGGGRGGRSIHEQNGDVSAIGGGSGGAGGEAVTGELDYTNQKIALMVGSGGVSKISAIPVDGGAGGDSSISIGTQLISVKGGLGGNKVKSISVVWGKSANSVGGDSVSRNGDGGFGRSASGTYSQREDESPTVYSATATNGGNGSAGNIIVFFGDSFETGGGGGGYPGKCYGSGYTQMGVSMAKSYGGGGDGNCPSGLSSGYTGHSSGYNGVVILRLTH